MTDEEIAPLFGHLYQRSIVNLVTIEERPPLLAHYTSLEVLEKIMENNEIWFSNPLFMNDLQEVRFGMLEGLKAFNDFALTPHFLEACGGSQEKVKIIYTQFNFYFAKFDAEHVLDVYVFCLSEHDPDNHDGVLSMWRGYGANGAGAALVFKTDSLTYNPASPFLFAKVAYASAEQRIQQIKATFADCAAVLKEHAIPADKLYHVAHHMFTLMKLYALVSKHHGFKEEREWRIIYLPDLDTSKLLTGQFSYIIGKNGIEPKLKIEPLKIEPVETWTLDSILDRIILGPSISSPIEVNSVRRMFDTLKKPEFKRKLCASGIPFRSRAQ